MSKKKEFIKNTAILTFGKICTQFISFFLLPLYTAILSPDEYGAVDLVMTYISLLIPIVCLQLDQGLFRYLLNIRDEKNKILELFSSILAVVILTTMFFLVVFILLSNIVQNVYFPYLIAGVFVSIYSNLFMQFSRGIGKIINYSIGSFITASMTVVFNVFFLVVLKVGPVGLFLSTLVANIINIIYLSISLKIHRFINLKKVNIKIAKEVIKYSVPFIPNQLSGWVFSVSDRTIISKVLGYSAAGIYSISNKVSGALQTLYSFVNTAWVESVALNYDKDDEDNYISEMSQTILSMFCSVCLMVISIFPFLYKFIINEKYAESYFHIPILLLAVFFQIILGLCSGIYIALKKSTTIARTTIVGAIVNILINIIFIKRIGLYAASISTLVSYMCVSVYRIIDIRKYIKLKIRISFIISIILAFTISIGLYYINLHILNIANIVFCIIFSIIINKNIFIILYEKFIEERKKKTKV